LYIKSNNGTPVKLGISKETYLKLFPPINRYNLRQGRIGDCYLVATLYSMYENPATREFILQCFSENENGDISISFGNGKISLTVGKNGEGIEKFQVRQILKFDSENPNGIKKIIGKSNMDGPLGAKLLEIAYGIETLQALIDKRFKEPLTIKQEKLLESPTDEAKGFLNNLFATYNDKTQAFQENIKHTATIRDGGLLQSFFSLIDIPLTEYKPADLTFADLMSKALNGPITAASKSTVDDTNFLNKELDIRGGHGYILKPFIDENGMEKIMLINPHHTESYTIIEYKDLLEYFNEIEVVENN